ncbi:MAG: hypothetical protein ACK5EU_02055 [Pseudanabaena sp.]|jgi:hypothetical protein|uniref:hypothetical protein n=1 Tax=Pseudanabaena mucicola TaxID=71190 RepID=UPI002578EA49|nr:hypothetical protein [Pseudanabaena mucicola]MCA6586057.1 hypothetical protein [Pseudanabaena sp. M051S1SP1A06QC]MCA6594889.1 hypothetical protein [Pseudanabaena sp. M046S1SP1A06QC]MCA6606391.1 hypothetical protein [Pseudanabaena sp. M007S1SP1A06QC]MCE2977754.1 hypothetical protein [Pseudanabaena sp. CoA8_M7]
MSAYHRLSQIHLSLSPSSSPKYSSFEVHPSLPDQFSQLIHEIEEFLLACSYEEMCKFWNSIANLRHYLHNSSNPHDVPQFLTVRRRQRDFCRILEVLAYLPYSQMHLSSHLSSRSNLELDRRTGQKNNLHPRYGAYTHPHLATQR